MIVRLRQMNHKAYITNSIILAIMSFKDSGIPSTTIIGVIPQYPQHTKNNIFSWVVMPPVGILSVLTNLKIDKKYDSYCIDENNYRGPLDFIGMPDHEFLQRQKPAKFAFLYGGMSSSILRMYSIAQTYKKFGSIVVAGGSHVDALPKEALSKGVDIVVHGEGEETAKEVVEAMLEGNPLDNIPGISFINEKGEYVFTGRREPINNLNLFESPDLTIVRHLNKKFTHIPISRGRGCNFNCEFCVVHDLYGSYKSMSPYKVVENIIKYSDLGYKEFFFTDDNFAQDIQDTINLCRMIGDHKRQFKKKIRLNVQVRTEIAENDELLEAMKYAGVKSLCIGYESPINEELKSMRKGVTAELLERRSRKLSKLFYIHGMFIFGYPSFSDSKYKSALTLKQKAKTYMRFIKRAKIDSFQIMKTLPLPGSVLREKLEKENRLLPLEMVNWDKYDGLWLCYNPKPEDIDPYELQKLPTLLMKRVYLGNFIESSINYGNWINWLWNGTLGFPLQFSIFYSKMFVKNTFSRLRNQSFMDVPSDEIRNLFYTPLLSAWRDIKRKWRNLAIKTGGGRIASRWYKLYNQSDYKSRLEHFFKKQRTNQ